MKTIEVNLIGDLKQSYSPGKVGRLPKAVTDVTEQPGDQKNKMILLGVSGSGITLLFIAILVSIITFGVGFWLDMKINKANDEITKKQALLAKYTKIEQKLLAEKKQLFYKKHVKDYLVKRQFPLADVLEELRVKIPRELTLSDVKKAKGGFLIKGSIPLSSTEPLRELTYFIININTMLPKESIVRNAFLASLSNKKEYYEFAIKASYKGASEGKKSKKK